MIYKDSEINISETNYTKGTAIIPLPNDQIACILEEGATSEELEIINQIKTDVEARAVPKPVTITPTPSLEERVAAVEAALLNMI